MTITPTLLALVERHEGTRALPYLDTEGVWTVGVGHNMTRPLSARAIQVIFEDDLTDAINDCVHAFPWYVDLTPTHQMVIVDMCFNLGLSRLRGFRKFLAAMEMGNYDTAATEMLDSLWARQVRSRALELAAMIRVPVVT